MAYRRDITSADLVFFDTDRILRYQVFQWAPNLDQLIAAGTAVPEDVAGQSFSWTLRRRPNSATALILKTLENAGSPAAADGIAIVGTYAPTMADNTQRVEITLHDTDTFNPEASPPINVRAGKYHYALKRTDEDHEDIKAFGTFQLLQAAGWEHP